MMMVITGIVLFVKFCFCREIFCVNFRNDPAGETDQLVLEGEKWRVWYGELLAGKTTSNNSGSTCFEVDVEYVENAGKITFRIFFLFRTCLTDLDRWFLLKSVTSI